MKRKVFLSLFVLLVFFCSVLGFQDKKQKIPPEQHEAVVRLVLVDVIVTEEGQFVKDLTKDDFELFEDGIRVPINSFELVSFEERGFQVVEEAKKEFPAPTPVQPKKKLMVLFDRINSWHQDPNIDKEIRMNKEKTVEELLSLIRLGNEVLVCQMTGLKGFEVLQPYTTEESRIREAVDMATGAVWHLGGGDSTAPPEEPGPEGIRSQGDPSAFNKAARMEALFRDRRSFEKTIEALLTAITFIKDESGRKSILLISTGIPDVYQLGYTEIGEHVSIFDPFNTLKKKSRQKAETVLEEIIRLANSYNISIYSLDADVYIRTIFTGADVRIKSDSSSDKARLILQRNEFRTKGKRMNLRWISEATGADFLRGAKKFENFREILTTDLNNYYLLSYYPRRKSPDSLYHSIEVTVNRPVVDVKHREGYNDYTEEEAHNLNLVAAFYNPSVFTQLPVIAEFIPLYTDTVCEPWMIFALPAQELFVDRFIRFAPKAYELHVWIADKQSGRHVSGGRIKLPFRIDEAFMDYLQTVDYIHMFFKGPEMKLDPHEYHAVFALVDPDTAEIGTCVSPFLLPEMEESEEGTILNAVLGKVEEEQDQHRPLGLSPEDGRLEFGRIRFSPRITGRFDLWEWPHVFIQVYTPDKENAARPEFHLTEDSGQIQPIPGELLVNSYEEEKKIWSGIFFLDTGLASKGENVLTVKIQGKDDSVLTKKIKLTIFQ
ncbi:MAG: VWA domain-containing protein [Candidatus Aminicenantes bacterium]